MTGSKKRTAAPRSRLKGAAQGSPGPAPAQATPSEDPDTLRQQAEEQVRRNAEAIRRVPLSVASEPAFTFKP